MTYLGLLFFFFKLIIFYYFDSTNLVMLLMQYSIQYQAKLAPAQAKLAQAKLART